MSEWSEVKKDIDRLVDFFEPVSLLKKIRDSVQGAEVEQVRLRNVIRQREAQIKELDVQVEAKKQELGKLTKKYEAAWATSLTAIENAAAARERELNEKLTDIQGQVAVATKNLSDLKKQVDQEMKIYAGKKAQVEAEIAAKQQEMEAFSQALSKLLKK